MENKCRYLMHFFWCDKNFTPTFFNLIFPEIALRFLKMPYIKYVKKLIYNYDNLLNFLKFFKF